MTLKPNKPGELYEHGKTWVESKTIWGLIVAICPIIFSFLGIDIGTVFTDNLNDTVQTANTVWNEVASLIGFVIAWWGRVKARYRIGTGQEE